MLLSFLERLRDYRVPVSLREFLDLNAALERQLVFADQQAFYFLARLCLVKDEKYFDRFDRAFADFFDGLDGSVALFSEERWSDELLAMVARAHPYLDETELLALVDEHRQRLIGERERRAARNNVDAGDNESLEEAEPGSRQQNESQPSASAELSDAKNSEEDAGDEGESNSEEEGEGEGEGEGDGDGEGEGEDGESGEGESGEEGEGVDGEDGLGQGESPGQGERTELDMPAQQSAAKVWQLRQYQDYDPDVELGVRNMKMALRRLRKFARTSSELELDLSETIRQTARNGGILDIIEVPERRNSVKVLLLLDVGGSMDDHVLGCAQLFSAARSEFKYLEYYYFHNFIYESLWHTNDRRQEARIGTLEVLNRFGSDYKIIFVGDANMARHEIAEKGGSVDHFNSEPGEVWLARFQDRFRKVAWLNPVATERWKDSYTTQMITRLMDGHMYHLGVDGIEQAMKFLAR